MCAVSGPIRHHALVRDDDFEAAEYQPLVAVHPALDNRWRDRFLDRFFAVSELSEKRRSVAKAMLSIDRGVMPDGGLVLRYKSPFMGSTTWYEWDGSEDEALRMADEEGDLKGYDVGCDQTHGPTGWEPEFDDR
jgi:hypothetical protein